MAMKKGTAQVLKWVCYLLVLYLCYILQTAFPMIWVFGIGAVWIVPAAVTISMLEGEKAAMAMGIITGFLWDFSSGKLAGFNALILMLCCVAVALLVQFWAQNQLWNALLFLAGTMLLQALMDYFFYYVIWGYENSWWILVRYMLPTILYTAVVTPLVYWVLRRIHQRFDRYIHV